MIALVMITILSGCSSDECYDNKNALPLAGCYGVSDGRISEVSVDSVEVYGVGAPGDSLLQTGATALRQFFIPFRIDSDTTRYVFRYLHQVAVTADLRDTVTFIYDREARFVSSACGASYVYQIREIRNTGLIIDSVVCPAMQITNADVENIKIYFPISQD